MTAAHGYWECVTIGCDAEATIVPTVYHAPFWCPEHDPARTRYEQIDVTPMDQTEPEYVNGAALGPFHEPCGKFHDHTFICPGPPTRTTKNRILWNRRPSGKDHVGDIDEIVVHPEWVHIEQMDDRCWWIGIDLPGGGYWAGNFHCDSRGRMRFSEQEQSGFEWDEDDTHEHPDPAEQDEP